MRALLAAAVLAGIGLSLPGCSLALPPAEVATRNYLEQARVAVRAHDGEQAMAALDQAEGAWLVANQARPNPIVHHERPALRDIGGARSAVQTENWDDAAYYIDSALRYRGALGA